MKMFLGYWNLRGVAEPIRYLLHYSGEKFEEKRYDTTSDGSNWFETKNTLGLDFPNLPYLIDGDLKLTQSLAILRYLARKHGLAGKDDRETAILDMLEQVTYDLLIGLIRLSYSPDFDAKIQSYIQCLPNKLILFSLYLGEKRFVLGDRLTYVDFCLYEVLDHHRMLVASCLYKFCNLHHFMERIEALPQIHKYMVCEDFIRWPIYAPCAKFGGKGEYPLFQ